MKKIILFLIFSYITILAQDDYESIHSGEHIDSMITKIEGIDPNASNLEPELVVTPAESKIVMDVDSVRIRKNLEVVGRLKVGSLVNISALQISEQLYSPFSALQSLFIGGLDDASIAGGILTAADITPMIESGGKMIYTLNGIRSEGNIYNLGTFENVGMVTFNDYTFPSVDGSAGTVMKTDGNGNLYWASDLVGGGSGGTGHADSLTILGRIIPGDSVVTKANLYSTTLTTANTFTVGSGSGAGANKIALGSTTNTIGATATIKPSQISGNITLSLPAVTGTLALINNISDSNFVLTSEVTGWDKNGSNDLVQTDTMSLVATKTNINLKLNKADSTASNGYATQYDIRNFITDGNTNWNNYYGYITGTPITYPDANTIAFGGDAIQLDEGTLEIVGGELITTTILTDLADGTIATNLVNTASPWADNEVSNIITVDEGGIAAAIARDSEVGDTADVLRGEILDAVEGDTLDYTVDELNKVIKNETISRYDISSPTVLDTFMIFWVDDDIEVDSIQVWADDSTTIQIKMNTTNMLSSAYLIDDGVSSTIKTINEGTLLATKKARLYFTALGNNVKKVHLKIYWRYL